MTRVFLSNNMNVKKNVTKFNKTHFVGYLNWINWPFNSGRGGGEEISVGSL